ncbi:MAG: VOC family protein [Betaproteobacteria bacterium]
MDLANARVGQLSIPVQDFERGVAFFRDTLGLPFLFSAPPQMAFFQCGYVRLLVGVPPKDEPPQRPCTTIYFHVEDIEAVHETLRRRGVRFRSEPHAVHRSGAMELWLAEFEDPDGNSLALMCEMVAPAAVQPA